MAKQFKTGIPGIEIHYGKIRISFQYQGSRCRENLNLAPTKANLHTAAKVREEILAKIRVGIFNYFDYFPDSENAKKYGFSTTSQDVTFGQYAKSWLKGHDHIAKSTHTSYRRVLNKHWMPHLARVPIRRITGSMIKEIVGNYPWKNNKTRNNALSPVRMIFTDAFHDGIIDINPAARLRSAKTQDKAPDPLTLDEVDTLLDYMASQCPPEIHSYFEFAIFSGCRTSELLALPWKNIDWISKSARIDRAKVLNELKVTKTCQIRDVELNSRALNALQRLRKLYPANAVEIFINPITKKPFVDDKPPRLWWLMALKEVGLRRRVAYQTRHTFATLNLIAGANPMWVARQLGHTTMKLLLERYSRWIDGIDARKEVSKIEAFVSAHTKNTPGKH